MPPPRDRIGAPWSPADRDGRDHVVDVAGNHDADRDLAIVRSVGRVKGAAAVVEADLAADRLAQVGCEGGCVDEEGSVASLRCRVGSSLSRSSMVIGSSFWLAGSCVRLKWRIGPRPDA